MTVLASVTSLLTAWVVLVGPVVALLALLNLRDRRAAELCTRAVRHLPAEALRSDLAVDVRCRLLSRAATVRLDLRGAPAAGLWDTAARLRGVLPAWVRVQVMGHVAPARPVRITVESAEPAVLRPAA